MKTLNAQTGVIVTLVLSLFAIACGPETGRPEGNGSTDGSTALDGGWTNNTDGGGPSVCTQTIDVPTGMVATFAVNSENISQCITDHNCDLSFAADQTTCADVSTCQVTSTIQTSAVVQATVPGAIFPPLNVSLTSANPPPLTYVSYSSVVIGSEQSPVAYTIHDNSSGSDVTANLYIAVATKSSGGTQLSQPAVVVKGFLWDNETDTDDPSGSVMTGTDFAVRYTIPNGGIKVTATGSFSSDGSSITIRAVASDGTIYNLTGVKQS